jgi:hypothetical protein
MSSAASCGAIEATWRSLVEAPLVPSELGLPDAANTYSSQKGRQGVGSTGERD